MAQRFLIPLVLLFANSALAEWQWTNDSATATRQKDWYTASYEFTNSGTHKATVTDLGFSCSCTVYKFKADTVKTGESGHLTVSVQYDEKRHDKGTELNFYTFGSEGTTPKKLTMILGK
jgi:hypothetical protein